MTLEELVAYFKDPIPLRSGGYICKCPAHKDSTQSLGVSNGRNNDRLIINCLAGCYPLDVLRTVNLGLEDLFHENRHDYVAADTSAYERQLARRENHIIERAIMRVKITNNWIATGKRLTQEEAKSAQFAFEYLKKHNMLEAV